MNVQILLVPDGILFGKSTGRLWPKARIGAYLHQSKLRA
ncbi:hypothetical protein CPter291_2496 [Collimonas pratensis]|uniref:Uncharacterized protein n=1 Tax=Collimonas pratensis TaxID=279113 RepID=A0ABM5Z708_9BURK|nr:hypothetical protein CPter291_2496 [Collimonas pratensis]